MVTKKSEEILKRMVCEALFREGDESKPVFNSSTFARVVKDEFDLRYTPSLGVVEPILAKVPYLVRLEACWWQARWRMQRPSMLHGELLD